MTVTHRNTTGVQSVTFIIVLSIYIYILKVYHLLFYDGATLVYFHQSNKRQY